MYWLEGFKPSQENLAIFLETQLNLEQIHWGHQKVLVTFWGLIKAR